MSAGQGVHESLTTNYGNIRYATAALMEGLDEGVHAASSKPKEIVVVGSRIDTPAEGGKLDLRAWADAAVPAAGRKLIGCEG